MRLSARVLRGNSKFSLLASAAAAVLLSACSSDMERFADNPTKGDDSIYTSSVPKGVQSGSGEDTAVSGRPLANGVIKPKPNYASNAYNYQNSHSQPVYRQPQSQPQEQHASATIEIKPGMTLYSVARANGISVGALASANGGNVSSFSYSS